MKRLFSNRKVAVYFIFIVIAIILGFTMGRIVQSINGVDLIIRGVIGGVTIYLLFAIFLTQRNPLDELNDDNIVLNFRMMLRHSIFFYFIFVIFAWAIQYVIDAVRFIF